MGIENLCRFVACNDLQKNGNEGTRRAFSLAHAREYDSIPVVSNVVRNDRIWRITPEDPFTERFSANFPHRRRKVGIENLCSPELRKYLSRNG